ncbi:hypothetical protein [Candidatus Nitrospira bockiana]
MRASRATTHSPSRVSSIVSPKAAERPGGVSGASVRYTTAEGQGYVGKARRHTAATLFIETPDLIPPGTSIAVVLILEGEPKSERQGRVAWVCPHPDEFGFQPGIGINLTAQEADRSPADLASLANEATEPS